MKLIIPLLLIVLMTIPVCSAGSGLSPVDIGAEMIAKGMDLSIIRIADGLMNFACGTNTTDGNTTMSAAAPSITGMISGFATWQVTPFKYPFIIKIMGMSLCCGAVFLVLYAFCGAGYVAVSGASDRKHEVLKYVLVTDGGDGALSNYAKNILVGCLAISFVVILIFGALLLSQVLKEMVMASIADAISPSLTSVPVLYLAMALMWVCVSVFFGISNIVICLTAAFSFLLGALYVSDRTRHLSTGWMDYFYSMVFMQIFVVTVVAIVVGIVMDIKTGSYGFLLHRSMELSLYLGLILFVMGGCALCVIGKVRLFKTAKTIVKMVI